MKISYKNNIEFKNNFENTSARFFTAGFRHLIIKIMFPKSASIMLLVAGLMLLLACLIDKLRGVEVNTFYLGFGAAAVIFSTAMLIFRKNTPSA